VGRAGGPVDDRPAPRAFGGGGRAACGRVSHRRIFPRVSRPHRPDGASHADRTPHPAPRARCPRCGASLGRLDVDAAADGAWYCGCCGLVVPDAGTSAAPR